MKYTVYLLLSISFLIACETTELEVLPENIYDIESTKTGEAYKIQVLLPKDYDDSKAYKVAYLTDGYYHFNYMRSEFANQSYLEDVILVGIFYRDVPLAITTNMESESIPELIDASVSIGQLRTIDLTFPENQQGAGGGGQRFYEFIESELIPSIEDRYSVDPSSRTIMGHSFGGYFAVYQMLEYASSSVFQNVISLDTQIWWADLYQLEEEARVFENKIALPIKMYLGAAKHANFDTNALLNEFVEKLEEHDHQGLEYTFERYKQGHAFSVKQGFSNGLKYIFNE